MIAPDGKQKPSHKAPRTARGQRTLRAILDAAATEFGEKGFREGSISGIMIRAGMAIGSFYTYFDSKEEVFTALVRDMSDRVRDYVAPRIEGHIDGIAVEQAGQQAYLEFVKEHKEIYRIVDEAEFVDPATFRRHYETTAGHIATRLASAAARGEVDGNDLEVRAWAIMGMNVFLGLRYGVWGEDMAPAEIARVTGDLLAHGIRPR